MTVTDDVYNDTQVIVDAINDQTTTLSHVINIQFAVLVAVIIFIFWRWRRNG